MSELDRLEAAIGAFEREADDDFLDPRRLAAAVDRLQGKLCRVVAAAKRRGDHLLAGQTPCAWVAATCRLSTTSASDRLCVGEQLQAMPQVAQALSSGEIGYQAASVICHFRHKLRPDLRQHCDWDWWVGQARESSLKDLSWVADNTRYVVDPEGFEHGIEEDWEQRSLKLSQSGGMFHISGVLDREGGAALSAAIQSLSEPLGQEDTRLPKQRRADALVEIVHHAMDQGTLPRRNGVRPKISVRTTLAGLKGELGAEASELEDGTLITSKTVQRLACDGSLHRVLKADSMVVDVGRLESPAQDLRRARLRPTDQLDLRPPCRLLGGGRADQPAQDAASVLLPPSAGARRRLAGGDGSRARRVHTARPPADDQEALGRESLGGLAPPQATPPPALRLPPPRRLRLRALRHLPPARSGGAVPGSGLRGRPCPAGNRGDPGARHRDGAHRSCRCGASGP